MIYVFEGGNIVYDGRNLSDAEKARSVAIEELPVSEVIEGKIAVLKADLEANKVYYEYIDKPVDAETDLSELKLANEMLTESLIDFKLQYMAVPCQSHQDYPVIIEGLLEGVRTDGE